MPEAVNTVWDRAIIQTCVIHLLGNTFRYASRKYWDQIAKDIRPVYTAVAESAAKERFVEFAAKRGAQYPAIIRLWENCLERIRALPGLRRRDPPGRLLHQRRGVDQRRYRRAIRARGRSPPTNPPRNSQMDI